MVDDEQVPEQVERSSVQTDDGADLAVWSVGDPSAPTVVLLHGFSLDHGTWEPIAEWLVGAGLRVVAPDLRGHGESTLGTEAPTVERFVSDVIAVVDQLGAGSPHIVGHSLGAVIALAARTDQRLSPASVTAIAATERAVQNPVMRLGAKLFGSSLGVRALRNERVGRLMISTWFARGAALDQLDWIRRLSAACPAATRSAVTAATADVDLRKSFITPGPPTQLIVGAADKATPPKISRSIAGRISHAELTVVDDAGHMVIIEQPDAVARQLMIATARRS